jgi:hypothetical protein
MERQHASRTIRQQLPKLVVAARVGSRNNRQTQKGNQALRPPFADNFVTVLSVSRRTTSQLTAFPQQIWVQK